MGTLFGVVRGVDWLLTGGGVAALAVVVGWVARLWNADPGWVLLAALAAALMATWAAILVLWLIYRSKVAAVIATISTNDPEEMVPLRVAARLAYEALEGTVKGMQANRPSNAPDGPLCFMAEKLFFAQMPIYGKRYPSSLTSVVPDSVAFDQKFKRDAEAIEDMDGRVTFTDLTAKRGDVEAAIEVLQGAYREH